MRKRRPFRDLTVQEILRRRPEAAQVFIQMRTQCVGCLMAGFCTPSDVAVHYGLDLADLLGLLVKETVKGR
ncbi:MAG: disulfide oxidoreductase [Spirochaetia bacterium]|jgi:hybrid cluster-associated redox disulfide protein